MAQNTSPQRAIFPTNVPRLRRTWMYTDGDAIESSPVVASGVYVGSQDHTFYALSAHPSEQLWSYTTEGGIISSPTVTNWVVCVGSNDHNLYAFNQMSILPGEIS